MLTHVVLFRFLEGFNASSAEAQAMHAALQKLPGLIDEIRDWQCGFNTTPDTLAWDYTIVATFHSRDDLYSYLEHPAHVSAVEMIERIAEIRFCDLE